MKNKLSKKQTFWDLYGDVIKTFLQVLLWILVIAIACTVVLLPDILYVDSNNKNFLFVYLIYFLIYIIGSSIIAYIRYDRLTRLPLTKEEKEQLKIYSAEDCIVFLNLYTRFLGSNFTLFSSKKFKEQVIEFIRSSMTENEKTIEEAFVKEHCWFTSYYDDSFISLSDCLLPPLNMFTYTYYGDFTYRGWMDWMHSDFCEENFKIALKENWTWEKYVEERDK